MNHDDVLERLSEIVESVLGRRPYDKDIAEEIGMSPANYSNMKKKRNLPLVNITDYCAIKKVSISWILYGQSSQMLADNTGDILKIPYLKEINGSAGGGAFNDDNIDITYFSLDRTYTDMLGIKEKDKIEAIKVVGDSMEDTLKDGAIILIDRNKTDIAGGGLFVVNTPNGVSVKRLMMNPVSGIDLISDNKIYLPQTVVADEVTVIGKVIGALERI